MDGGANLYAFNFALYKVYSSEQCLETATQLLTLP